jgi:hypothetical protein
MRTTRARFLIAAVSVPLVACATTLEVDEVLELGPDAALDGVPFRMPAPYALHVYEKSDKGYRHVKTFAAEMADTDKLFTIDFESKVLADPTFSLQIADDGTIQKLSLDSTLKADDVLGAVAGAAKEAKDALLAAEELEQTRLKRLQDAETAREADADAQELARLAAYEAFLAAETAVAEYVELLRDPAATTAQRVAKRNQVHALRAKANMLYRQAGMTPPYDLDLPG